MLLLAAIAVFALGFMIVGATEVGASCWCYGTTTTTRQSTTTTKKPTTTTTQKPTTTTTHKPPTTTIPQTTTTIPPAEPTTTVPNSSTTRKPATTTVSGYGPPTTVLRPLPGAAAPVSVQPVLTG